ncbi:MAG: Calx-beta domain-containing protein, partial [Pseudomonadota bacterium]
MISRILAAIALIALGACSSGGGSDTDPPATPPPSSTPTPGSLQFVLDSVTVNETAGIAAVQVERSGGQDGIVTADVVFIAQSAGISDVSLDVTAVSFGDGDNAAKDVAFTVIDDSETEGNETFAIELGNPGGGATLGAVASAAITIVDNDSVAPTPSAGFAINDTGVSLCATGLETGIACDAAGATSDYPGQDAERG